MPIQTRHFRVRRPEARVREYEIAGFTGKITKKLNHRLIVIEQRGWAGWETDDERDATIAELDLGRGDPSVLFSVDTLRQGTYENCWKVSVEHDPVGAKQTPSGLMAIEYRITWQQVVEPI